MSSSPTARGTQGRRTPWQVQRAVWFALLQRDLKARFEGRWLGGLWALFEPVALLAMMLMVFGYLRSRVVPGMPFPLFLVTGMIPFLVFRNVMTRVMGAIDSSRGLFGYRQVKPIDVVVSRAAMEVLIYSAIFFVFLAVLGWSGMQWFPDHPLHLAVAGLVMIALGFGLGLILAVSTDDFPQFRVFVRLMFMPLYFLSGVIFPVSSLPANFLPWLLWNPLLHLVEIHRGYFVENYHVIDEVNLAYPSYLTLITLAFGLALYRVRRLRLLAS
ncbi:ABC transporter permease [Methylibium sp.]|uniref:ABC transporter permease n=1 Tax=Methylibium sp. TaxID=2067992 RepID=UPI0018132D27|nr:ABC transporter permease [Methylibium sp.]MBA3588116.1 ABC transporter permease [Methylibium sp.]